MTKQILVFLFAVVAGNLAAQDRDFNPGLSGISGDKQYISVGEHVMLQTGNIRISSIERIIVDLESRECKALLKRDTVALRDLWTRDFTLNENLDKVIYEKSNLPYYIAIARMIEKLNVAGNLAFTSGYEVVQQLSAHGKLEEPVKQSFFHTWTNRNGVWKLSTKTR